MVVNKRIVFDTPTCERTSPCSMSNLGLEDIKSNVLLFVQYLRIRVVHFIFITNKGFKYEYLKIDIEYLLNSIFNRVQILKFFNKYLNTSEDCRIRIKVFNLP